jgi:phosphoserine phosphatase RsbX
MQAIWGVATRPKQGQSISGDAFVVEEYGEQQLLASVIDGLGGGVEAARASENAVTVLREYPGHPLSDLIKRAHQALHGTRGAVIAMVQLNLQRRQMTFAGIGNIGIQAYSSTSIKPISKNGILGYRLPTLLCLDYSYNSGDTFVLYSDGISSRFGLDNDLDVAISPQALADAILGRYGKQNDDATVLVLRCP